MNIKNVITSLKLVLSSKSELRPMLRGKPGMGKSAIVYEVAKQMGLPVIEFRPCLHDPIDLMGIPKDVDGKTTWLVPSWLPTSGEGILFIDEFPQATPAMQNALSQLIYGGKLEGYTLPKGWKIVLAGNRQCDKAATFKMPSHISNRIVFLDVEYSSEDWVSWGISVNMPSVMLAFAQYRPKIMDEFDPNKEINCTPRTFSEIRDFIDFPELLRSEVIGGTIGEGPAVEFEAFIRVWKNIKTFEEILEAPSKIETPKKMDEIYATVQMLAERTDVDTLPRIEKYIERLGVEFELVFYKNWIDIMAPKTKLYELIKIPAVNKHIDKLVSVRGMGK